MEALLTKVVLGLSIGLQVVIIFLLLRRHLQRRFRWFLIYIAYALIEAALRFSVVGNKKLYFNVYWLTAIGGVALSVTAVRESFLNVFWMYTRFRWFVRIVWGCVSLALAYAGLRAWLSPPVHATHVGTLVIDLELALDISLGLVGILYLVLVRFHKVLEHQWESAVISGFMTIGILSALGTLGRSVFGKPLTGWVLALAYLLAEIEWVLVLMHPERETPKWIREFETSNDDLTRLDEYSRILDRLRGG